jgi:hypothetical protein
MSVSEKIKPYIAYYGWLLESGEFVSFVLSGEGQLNIITLRETLISIRPGRWRFKWALFGEGKISFTTFVRGTPITLTIRIYPITERDGLMNVFCAGRNGPLNTKSDFVFSAIAEESDDRIHSTQ